MGDQKRNKKTIWIYAVVLFTSAFIVLLLTAYSQIKFNKNISDYRAELSNKEKEKVNFQMNLNTALDENKKIKAELEDLKGTIEKEDSDKLNYKNEIEKYVTEKEKTVAAYETLISAEKEYMKGNVIESAKILVKQCDRSLLQKEAQDKYKELVEKTVKVASYKLYIEGYSDFKNKRYDGAIEKLLLSNEMVSDDYYSDDCLYFVAYSKYKLGDNEGAKNTFDELKQKYPSSNYIKELDKVLS